YAEEGNYQAVVTVTDSSDGDSATATATIAVSDAALTIEAGALGSLTEGGALSGVLATFTDTDPQGTLSDYSATIDWGEGSAPGAGTVQAAAGGGFSISGSHVYTEEGNFTVTVTAHDQGGASASATASLHVADAALSAAGTALSGYTGQPLSGVVATFTDAD